MKTKFYIFVILLASAVFGFWLMSVAHADINTYHRLTPERASATNVYQWVQARDAAVTADDTTPDPSGMTWAAAVAGDYYGIDSQFNTLSLAFYVYGDGTDDGDSNGATFDCNVYVVEPYSGWEHVASFGVTAGEMELTHNPVSGAQLNSGSLDPNESYKWVEGPFTDALSDSDAWPTTVNLSGVTNGIGKMNIDTLGATGLIVLIDNMANCTSIVPVVKGR